MARLFVANFDFEHQLERTPRGRASEPLERINRELAAAWIALADDGDLVWLQAEVDPEFFLKLAEVGLPRVRPVRDVKQVPRDVEVCPWGWSPTIRQWATKNKWNVDAPPSDVVALANSRTYSAMLERQWELAIPGAATVAAIDDLHRALATLASASDRWVVKADLGMSARERVLGQGSTPAASSTNWIDKRLRAGERLFFEPWVERLEEVGLQFTVARDGAIRFEGCTPLLTLTSGQYSGSRFAHDALHEQRWQPAIDVGLRAAGELAQRGYFGPLGIDALRYRDTQGVERLRPLQDINARYTMGRLALGFRRLLAPGEVGSWLHIGWPHAEPDGPQRWFAQMNDRLPAGVRMIQTTPYRIENQPTHHGSLVVLASDYETLIAAERTIFATEN